MTTEPPVNDIKILWRNQKTEGTAVTLENIHERAAKFQKRVRNRNLREYIVIPFLVLVFGWYMWIFPGWMMKTGSALSIAAVLFVAWQLYRRGLSQRMPEGSGMGLVEFHRHQLVRQRDLLKSALLWYIAPLFPGVVLITLGRWFQFHAPWRSLAWDHEVIILVAVIMALGFGIIWLVNVLAATKLQRKIDELDKLRED